MCRIGAVPVEFFGCAACGQRFTGLAFANLVFEIWALRSHFGCYVLVSF